MAPTLRSVPWAIAGRILRYAVPHWRYHVMALGCSLAVTAASFALPLATKLLVDDVFVASTRGPGHQLAALRLIVCLTVAGAIVSAVGGIISAHLFARAGELATAGLRRDLFRHLHHLPISYFDARKTGGIMSVLHSDVEVLQGLYSSSLVDIISNGLLAAAASAILLWISPVLAALTLPIPVLFAWNLSAFYASIGKISTKVREDTSEVQEVLQESISGTREVRLFAREGAELERYGQKVHQLVSSRVRLSVREAACASVANTLSSLGLIVLIAVGGLVVIRNPQHLSAGSLILFINGFFMLFGPANVAVRVYNQLASSVGAADRVFGFLDSPAEPEAEATPAAPLVGRQLHFRDVSFGYGQGEPALSHVDVSIESQETIALVGPSGAGKTTLVSLIARLYDATSGSILIDGVDIRAIPLSQLRGAIAFVPQEPFLFSTTIADNIRLGRPQATMEEVVHAAEGANAHGFIQSLPSGYDTDVGERGVRLSVGQRQRLAIARALLKDPRILILDEATSAQDAESERLLQEATNRLMAGRTSLVIAHRFSTAMWADRIIVLDRGRVVGVGRHDELLGRCETYARLYSMSGHSGSSPSPCLIQSQS